jgi:hypothetical protein
MSAKQRCVHRSTTCRQTLNHFDNVFATGGNNICWEFHNQFGDFVDCIYPIELEIQDTTDILTYASKLTVTWRFSVVKQELLTLPEHMNSPPVFSGVRVARSLVFCVVFCRSLFVLFLLAIVLSIHRCTNYDYPFGIFKLFSKLSFLVIFVRSIIKLLTFHHAPDKPCR